jgi:phosphate-selective porin OprO/OprP
VGTSGQPAPGSFNGTPPFVNTGSLKTISQYNVLGTELLWVQGPLSVQSEAQVNFVNQTGGNATAVLPGAYAQVGYFLTGEHRPYDRKAGAIDRVIPFRNFGPWSNDCEHSGWGAWEIAGRWSHLDLNDHNIQGGSITDYTAGVNWYVNPYWKIVFNYVHSDANAPRQVDPAVAPPLGPFIGGTPGGPHVSSSTDMFALRAQMDF